MFVATPTLKSEVISEPLPSSPSVSKVETKEDVVTDVVPDNNLQAGILISLHLTTSHNV